MTLQDFDGGHPEELRAVEVRWDVVPLKHRSHVVRVKSRGPSLGGRDFLERDSAVADEPSEEKEEVAVLLKHGGVEPPDAVISHREQVVEILSHRFRVSVDTWSVVRRHCRLLSGSWNRFKYRIPQNMINDKFRLPSNSFLVQK